MVAIENRIGGGVPPSCSSITSAIYQAEGYTYRRPEERHPTPSPPGPSSSQRDSDLWRQPRLHHVDLSWLPTRTRLTYQPLPGLRSDMPPATQRRPPRRRNNDWTGPWYDPVANPKRLDDTEKERMIRQGRCWSCRGSGHRSADDCCPMHSLREKRLHALSTGDLIELDSSEDEKAGKA